MRSPPRLLAVGVAVLLASLGRTTADTVEVTRDGATWKLKLCACPEGRVDKDTRGIVDFHLFAEDAEFTAAPDVPKSWTVTTSGDRDAVHFKTTGNGILMGECLTFSVKVNGNTDVRWKSTGKLDPNDKKVKRKIAKGNTTLAR